MGPSVLRTLRSRRGHPHIQNPKGTGLAKLAELMVGYKVGDNFPILRCHDFAMQKPIRDLMGLPEFSVRGLYRAVETLDENREAIITAFRKRFLREYGPERTDAVFDWTSLVYFGSKPDMAMRGHSKDGHPEKCQMNIGVSQLAKPVAVPIGMTVMPGNTHDAKHMKETYGQVAGDLTEDSTMIFDVSANSKPILDMITDGGKHFLTRKRLNRSDDRIFSSFSKNSWDCMDAENG